MMLESTCVKFYRDVKMNSFRFFLLFFSFLLIPKNSFANLKELALDLIKNNHELYKGQEDLKNKERDPFWNNAHRDLILSSSLFYKKDKLESLSSSYNPDDTTGLSIGLDKKLSKGFSLSWKPSFYFFKEQSSTYNLDQKLTLSQDLSQDFLGKKEKLQKNLYQISLDMADLTLKNKIEETLFTLSTKYLMAQIGKHSWELMKEFHTKANKRKDLILKRVRDGLNDKVDGIEASIGEIVALEKINSAEADYFAALKELANLVHREVTDENIESIHQEEWKEIEDEKITSNLSLKILKQNLMLADKTLTLKRRDLLPQVSVSLSYRTNKYDSKMEKAYTMGWPVMTSKDETQITAALSIPFTRKEAKLNIEKAAVDKKVAEYSLQKIELNINREIELINKQMHLFKINIEKNEERKQLATKKLSEYNRQYFQGRADLDLVIRAEEDLLKTELEIIKTISDFKMLYLKKKLLFGQMKNILI